MRKLKRNRNKRRKFIILGMVCILCVMSAGYAAFQTNLNISVKGNIKDYNAAWQLKKNVVDSGDGLYKDNYEEDRYVYKGGNPDNYITFNNELWRIISVESDDTLKIMKKDSIGNFGFDYPSNQNNWSNPVSLNSYLNNSYYSSLSEISKNLIQTHEWNIGFVDEFENIDSLAYTINQEKSSKWNGNVALITISDFIKADSDIRRCSSIKLITDNSNWENPQNSTCWNTNYISNSMLTTTTNLWMWLLTPKANVTNSVWRIRNFNYLHISAPNNKDIGVLPALHLKSDIKLKGSGTLDNPYTIV